MRRNMTKHVADSWNNEDEKHTAGVKASLIVPPNSKEKVAVSIIWINVVVLVSMHLATLYGFYLGLTSAIWKTNLTSFLFGYLAGLGVTAGAHRLWAHRCYKARLPLRIFLAFAFTVASERDIYDWCRDHRVHHKYSETDADPHNAKRGFFFSHVGWLMCHKHPDVLKKGKSVDLSDLMADPVVVFHRKYYLLLLAVCSFILPTAIPIYFWNETFLNSFLIATVLRQCMTYNSTWFVNSAAHMWGSRPYDNTINPRQNAFVVFVAMGEGFHNYHHTFPYDYATSEYGIKYNFTTAFIDLMALFGLAYDRKTASKESIQGRKLRTGVDKMMNSIQEASYVKEE